MVKKITYNTKKKKPGMVREAVVSVYQSGHSKVVTIPAGFPVEVGDKFRFYKRGGVVRANSVDESDESDMLQSDFVGMHKGRKDWKNKSSQQLANDLRKKAWYGE